MRHVAGALALAFVLVGAGAASAQYPPTVGAGRVSRTDLKQCQCTQFTGDGFAPGTPVSIVDVQPDGTERVVGTEVADAKGGVKSKVCFDETAPQGRHTLVARGADAAGNAHEDRATVTVSGSVCYGHGDEVHPNANRDLGGGPRGGSVVPASSTLNVPAVASGTLLALGGALLLLLLARHRRRDEPTPAPV
jgi:hypothetical protein